MPASSRVSSGRLKILIVDDCPDIRELMVHALMKNFDVDVFEAESGEASADVLRNFPIDLTISDLLMPGGSGQWLHQFIKDQFPKTPLILFTACEDTERLPKRDEVLKVVVPKPDLTKLILEARRVLCGFYMDAPVKPQPFLQCI